MRTSLALILVVAIVLPRFASGNDPAAPRPGQDGDQDSSRTVSYLYYSPLIVWEEISDLGGGVYRYSYRFENVDSNHIWHFGVWTTFDFTEFETSWSDHPLWYGNTRSIETVYSVYDGRNLDPDIIYSSNTWARDWPDTPDPISPGAFVEGFSFTATVHDDSPKWYFYETIESGWAYETGFVAAVGLTGSVVAVEAHPLSRVKALFR